jgi:23S rRNA (uracil-5-)-methyltransferase RumA
MSATCPLYGRCGGCRYDGADYAAELKTKEEKLIGLFTGGPGGGGPLPEAFFASAAFEGTIPSPEEEGYRNKMEFSFGNETKDGPLTLGLHQKKSFFNILPADACRIAPPDFRRIVAAVQTLFREKGTSFCHKKSHEGILRHLVLRRSATTGELLINLVTQRGFTEQEAFVGCLSALPLEGRIAGILHTENNSLSDAVVPERINVLYGEPRLSEKVCGLDFEISPFSFFQTNTRAAELLYEKVREYISVTPDSLVYDLYSGTGTIAQILAPVAGQVFGVEIVEEAVEAARRNAAANGLTNCRFIAGDVLKKLEELPPEPDYIILDPPRDGVHPKALGRLASSGAKRIVYVSCKPASLSRDLPAFFWAGYRAEKMAFADLFPKTDNCEAVVLLSKGEISTKKIRVEFSLEDMDMSGFQQGATYDEIQEWVQEKYGFHVTHLNIAQVKQKHGIIERENYNKPKSPDSRQPNCPEEKVKAIEEALKAINMI